MPTISDTAVFAALCAGVGGGAAVDAASRRIPNEVVLATATVGILLAAMGISGISVAASLAGLALGFTLMLPGYFLGGTGAGDVKLFAAAGTLLGIERIVPAFLLTAIAGGVLAVGFAWWRGRLARTVTFAARLCRGSGQARAEIESPVEHNRFPYGPAIAIGCLLAGLM